MRGGKLEENDADTWHEFVIIQRMTNANVVLYVDQSHAHTQKLAPRQGNTLGIAKGRG